MHCFGSTAMSAVYELQEKAHREGELSPPFGLESHIVKENRTFCRFFLWFKCSKARKRFKATKYPTNTANKQPQTYRVLSFLEHIGHKAYAVVWKWPYLRQKPMERRQLLPVTALSSIQEPTPLPASSYHTHVHTATICITCSSLQVSSKAAAQGMEWFQE